MKLVELEPQFVKLTDEPNVRRYVDTLAEAQGICFLCPACLKANGGQRPGVHSVLCWARGRGVPDAEVPGPGRWEFLGTGYHDLTFRAGNSSVLLTGCPNHAHFFITNGEIVLC